MNRLDGSDPVGRAARSKRVRAGPSEATLVIPRGVRDASPGTRNTPLLPPPPVDTHPSRAILTVLTGPDAGRTVAIGPGGVLIGREASADLPLSDPAASRRHARIAVSPGGNYYVEDLDSTNGTFVRGMRVRVHPLASGDTLQIGTELRLRFAFTDQTEESGQRRLYEAAVRDSLTGAFSRTYLVDRMATELTDASESSRPISVMMIDVDELKGINDRCGHFSGDRALRAVASLIAGATRAGDVVARYGGDEFVVLMPGADLALATRVALRVRSAVAKQPFIAGGKSVAVTVSVGVASLSELGSSASPPSDLLSLADARLYEAKRAGRNRVSVAGSPEQSTRDLLQVPRHVGSPRTTSPRTTIPGARPSTARTSGS